MPAKSKLNPYKDQIMLWSINMTTRAIAARLKELGGPSVNHSSIAAFIAKIRAEEQPAVDERAMVIEQTIQGLVDKGLNASLLVPLKELESALKRQDSEAALGWHVQLVKALSVALDQGGVRVAVVQQQAQGQEGDLWSVLRRLKDH